MHPIMAVGIALAFIGFGLFAGVLFGTGGASKSKQFQVIGEVLGGRHGPGRKRAMLLGLVMTVLGTCTTFAGVTAHDARRAPRCQAYCLQQGYTRSEIGPSDATADGGRRVAFVACTCTRADGARTQTRADDL
ncbi:MAG: hypothetical protein Q8S73_44545 [Deltaproteobacteria bacterium]|nr:hypothetical protein [Deltaproteobacteria bacterium]